MWPNAPNGLPLNVAPKDWHASSMSYQCFAITNALECRRCGPMAPHICTTMTALVRGLRFFFYGCRIQAQGFIYFAKDGHRTRGQYGF